MRRWQRRAEFEDGLSHAKPGGQRRVEHLAAALTRLVGEVGLLCYDGWNTRVHQGSGNSTQVSSQITAGRLTGMQHDHTQPARPQQLSQAAVRQGERVALIILPEEGPTHI